jgi:hypothetical protein
MPYAPSDTRLGVDPKTGADISISHVDRYSGMYVLGTQGMGKSGFLQTLVYDDICKGMAVVVIDPHGDLVTDIVSQLPQQYMSKVFMLDVEDEDYPFGVNLFAGERPQNGMEWDEAVERIVRIFYLIFPGVEVQASLPSYLRAAAITLLENPGSTLVDMLGLLTDAAVRRQMVARVHDEWVRDFWQKYDEAGKASIREVYPLVRRLNSLFMGRSLIRNIVGQRKNSIDFRRAIEQHQIILIKLPSTTSEEVSRLIGTLLMSQLQAAIFSFRDMPTDQRPGVSVYADEFQTSATQDIEKLFTQGRKFGVRLTVAHQFIGQLEAYLQRAVKTPRTKVFFRTTADDAATVARLFNSTETKVTPASNPVRELLNNTPKDPAVRAFVEGYLRPLKHYQLHGNIKITHRGDDFRGEIFNFGSAFFNAPGHDKPEMVEDPTDALNSLLRDVMESRSVYLPIDPIIPRGYCNAGLGFAAITRGLYDGHPALQPNFEWPLHLVHGNYWVKRPDSAREQFYHFLFSLRQTMRYLAANPIGKVTESSTGNKVAQWLANLPPRTAYVQTSTNIATMRTLDIPPAVDHEALQARLFFIRQQTRQTYCHPRAEVEAVPVAKSEPVAAGAASEATDSIGDIAGWGGEP